MIIELRFEKREAFLADWRTQRRTCGRVVVGLGNTIDEMPPEVAPLVAIPQGFTRKKSLYQISPDRRTLEFVLEDEEDFPPDGPLVVEAAK